MPAIWASLGHRSGHRSNQTVLLSRHGQFDLYGRPSNIDVVREVHFQNRNFSVQACNMFKGRLID